MTREYNLKNLFLPSFRELPLRGKIGLLMIHPVTWALELILGGLLIFYVLIQWLGVLPSISVSPLLVFLMILVGGIAAFLFPIIYLIIAWLLDFFEREPLRFIVSAFLWGIASTTFAFIINTLIGLVILKPIFGATAMMMFASAVIIAPIVEESLKGFGLLIIAGHDEMNDTFDGMLYGFAVGVGFAAVENFYYFTVKANPFAGIASGGLGSALFAWFVFMLYRSTICAIGHGCFTATTGMFMGFCKNRPSISRFAQVAFIPGVLLAMFLHGTFNFSAMLQGAINYSAKLPGLMPIVHGPWILVVGGIYLFIIAPLALWETKVRVKREKEQEAKTGVVARKTPIQPIFAKKGSLLPTTTKDVPCSKCKTINPPNTPFCTGCGAKLLTHEKVLLPPALPPAEKPLGKVCPSCQRRVSSQTKFCPFCGANTIQEVPKKAEELTKTEEKPAVQAVVIEEKQKEEKPKIEEPIMQETIIWVETGCDLVLISGPEKGKTFHLGKDMVKIRRGTSMQDSLSGDVLINDMGVSRSQAELRWDNEQKIYTLIHMKEAKNPTMLNESSLPADTPEVLNDGDKIRIGQNLLQFKQKIF